MIPHGIAKAEEHFINTGFFDHCPGLLKGSGHLCLDPFGLTLARVLRLLEDLTV